MDPQHNIVLIIGTPKGNPNLGEPHVVIAVRPVGGGSKSSSRIASSRKHLTVSLTKAVKAKGFRPNKFGFRA